MLELIGFGDVAGRLTNGSGDDVPGRNRQRIASVVVHPILVSEETIAAAHPGVELLVPVSRVDNEFAGPGAGRATGLGDITAAAFLQWSSADRPGAGTVSVRAALQWVAPTGSYRSGRAVNTGQGGWQVSPYVATTWRVSDRWEMSARAIYDWSGSATTRQVGDASVRVRPGDLIALNLSASCAVLAPLRVGIGAYFLEQVRDARVEGRSVDDSRGRVFAVGPVTRLQAGKLTVLAAAFGEFGARNRSEGVTVNVRLQRPF